MEGLVSGTVRYSFKRKTKKGKPKAICPPFNASAEPLYINPIISRRSKSFLIIYSGLKYEEGGETRSFFIWSGITGQRRQGSNQTR